MELQLELQLNVVWSARKVCSKFISELLLGGKFRLGGKFLSGGNFPLDCEFPLKWNFSWNFSATNIVSRIFSCTTFLVEDFFTNILHGSFNINILSGNYVTNNFRRIFGELSNVGAMNLQLMLVMTLSNTLTQVFPNTERLVHAYMQTRWFRFVFVFNTFRTSVT